jgi:hypothetical protein
LYCVPHRDRAALLSISQLLLGSETLALCMQLLLPKASRKLGNLPLLLGDDRLLPLSFLALCPESCLADFELALDALLLLELEALRLLHLLYLLVEAHFESASLLPLEFCID